MQKAACIIFFFAWLLCGCSVESFFEGGAPVAIIAVLVAIACVFIMRK